MDYRIKRALAYQQYQKAFNAVDNHDFKYADTVSNDDGKTKKVRAHFKCMFEGSMLVDVPVDDKGETNEATVLDAMNYIDDQTFLNTKETKLNFFLLKEDSESGLGYDEGENAHKLNHHIFVNGMPIDDEAIEKIKKWEEEA